MGRIWAVVDGGWEGIPGDGDRNVNSLEVERGRTCKLLEIRNIALLFCILSALFSSSIKSY